MRHEPKQGLYRLKQFKYIILKSLLNLHFLHMVLFSEKEHVHALFHLFKLFREIFPFLSASTGSLKNLQHGRPGEQLRAPEKRVSLVTKDPGLALMRSFVLNCILFGGPDSTKNAPFCIRSPSDLHVQSFHTACGA